MVSRPRIRVEYHDADGGQSTREITKTFHGVEVRVVRRVGVVNEQRCQICRPAAVNWPFQCLEITDFVALFVLLTTMSSPGNIVSCLRFPTRDKDVNERLSTWSVMDLSQRLPTQLLKLTESTSIAFKCLKQLLYYTTTYGLF